MTEQAHLVVFDADNISGYVFETGRLKEIRGGSHIVRACTQKEQIVDLARSHDAQAKVIYADGGAGMVRFTTKSAADAFIAALKRSYRRQTISGTVSAEAVLYPAGSFAETVSQANAALRRQKDSTPQNDRQFTAGPYTAICVSCGRRPVWASYRTIARRVDALCAACLNRRQADDRLNKEAQAAREGEEGVNERRVRLQDLARIGDPMARMFLQSEGATWGEALMPEDLEQLGALSLPRNYLGFVHADGNRMGEHLRNFADWLQASSANQDDEWRENRYGSFSEAIGEATATALAAALHRAFPYASETAPFDSVLLAGDDVILLVAAHKALDVAVDFCTSFEQVMGEKAAALGYSEPITTAVGVVLANAHQPILYLQQQAKDLQKEAKRLCARQWAQGAHVSAIDFSVVTTPVLRPLRAVRAHDYTLEEHQLGGSRRKLRLTRRPYTATEMKDFLALVRRLKGLALDPEAPSDFERRSYPRSQLHALYETIFQGHDQAQLQGARASLRVSGYQRVLLKSFAERFDSNQQLPWGSSVAGSDDYAATAFTDLVEIYDFLHDAGSQEEYDG